MRIIQAPGIELHEIDRSQYDETENNSIVGTTAFLMGFADKGDDYTTKYINSMNTFVNNYGYPTNEAERYFYNAAYEVIDRGGFLLATKLPYDNESLRKYAYCSYSVDESLSVLSSPYDVVTDDYGDLSGINLYKFLMMPDIQYTLYCGIENENKKEVVGIDQDETDYLADESDDQTVSVLNYLDKISVDLSIITDLFEYIHDQCNFPYSTYQVIKKYFYKTDKVCRNDAIYRLKYLESKTVTDFIHQYGGEITEYDSDRAELSSMLETLDNLGRDFDTIIEKFGKTISLRKYWGYFDKLSSDVENATYDGEGIKDSFLAIMSSYNKEKYRSVKYTEIKHTDENLTSFIEIHSNPLSSKYSGMLDMESLDKFRIDESKVPKNQIYIVDLTRQKYQKDEYDPSDKKEYVGILPVITTAANALYYQKFIEQNLQAEKDYNCISCIQNKYTTDLAYVDDVPYPLSSKVCNLNNDDTEAKKIAGFVQNIGPEKNVTEDQITLSKTAAQYFPAITYKQGHLSPDEMKKIGIVVFKMYIDESSDGMIGFTPVEAFCGSLNRKDVDINTGATTFIDKIVNTNSNYINCFSNVKFSNDANLKRLDTDRCSTYLIHDQAGTSLGLYEKDCQKDISVKESIFNAIDLIFDNNKDCNTIPIDIVVDAGVSNIAQFIKSVYKKEKGKFDFSNDLSYLFRLDSATNAQTWATVIRRYDSFCKNVRKDCMFVADGMRPLCLVGEEKRVRPTKPENTIENQIIPRLRYISGILNSSYGAGYCNWFRCIDRFSEEYYWCPPSIKATGVYIYTDAYSHYWMAPAGLRRGVMQSDVIDVAFNPTNDEAGKIYINNWNYAVSYPLGGIVLEGQKTMQKDKTALDRVNVRRLFLGLEKTVRYLAKYFTYEGITDYLMQRFRDTMTPIFEDAKTKDGLKEYVIICDSRNNNTQTIENNELHCTIGVKPIKSLEFLVINFVASSQGASVSEVAESEL